MLEYIEVYNLLELLLTQKNFNVNAYVKVVTSRKVSKTATLEEVDITWNRSRDLDMTRNDDHKSKFSYDII